MNTAARPVLSLLPLLALALSVTACYHAIQPTPYGAPPYVIQAERSAMDDPLAVPGWIALGDAYEKAKLYDRASRAYGQALRLDPENALVRSRIAALGANRPLSDAERHALDNPTDDEAWGDAGDEHMMLGRNDVALQYFLVAMKLDPADGEWPRKAWECGGEDVVMDFFEGRLAEDPGNDELLGDLADALAESGDTEAALQFYQRAHDADPGDSEWIDKLYELGGIAVGFTGDASGYGAAVDAGYDTGLVSLLQAMAEEDGMTLEQMGLADLVGAGQGGGSMGEFGGLTGAAEVDDESLGDMGDSLIGAGDRDGALAYYTKALEMDPADPEWTRNVALFGGQDLLLSTLRNLLDQHPDQAAVHGSLGDVLAYRGERDEALRHYQRALRLDPSNEVWLGRVALLGGIETANGIIAESLADHAENDEVVGGYGELLAWRGETDRAMEQYQRGLQLDPEDTEWSRGLGILGGFEVLIPSLEQAVEANPTNDELVGDLGDLYAMRGEYEAAVECYIRASRLDDEDTEWPLKIQIFRGLGGSAD